MPTVYESVVTFLIFQKIGVGVFLLWQPIN